MPSRRGSRGEGAGVWVNGRTQARVDEAIANIKKQAPEAKLHPLVADIGTNEGAQKAINQVKDIDILVNNLGIYERGPSTR